MCTAALCSATPAPRVVYPLLKPCSTPTPRYTFNMRPFPPAFVRQLHLTDEQESHGDLDKGPKAEGPHKEAREHVLASVRSVE